MLLNHFYSKKKKVEELEKEDDLSKEYFIINEEIGDEFIFLRVLHKKNFETKILQGVKLEVSEVLLFYIIINMIVKQ